MQIIPGSDPKAKTSPLLFYILSGVVCKHIILDTFKIQANIYFLFTEYSVKSNITCLYNTSEWLGRFINIFKEKPAEMVKQRDACSCLIDLEVKMWLSSVVAKYFCC